MIRLLLLIAVLLLNSCEYPTGPDPETYGYDTLEISDHEMAVIRAILDLHGYGELSAEEFKSIVTSDWYDAPENRAYRFRFGNSPSKTLQITDLFNQLTNPPSIDIYARETFTQISVSTDSAVTLSNLSVANQAIPVLPEELNRVHCSKTFQNNGVISMKCTLSVSRNESYSYLPLNEPTLVRDSVPESVNIWMNQSLNYSWPYSVENGVKLPPEELALIAEILRENGITVSEQDPVENYIAFQGETMLYPIQYGLTTAADSFHHCDQYLITVPPRDTLILSDKVSLLTDTVTFSSYSPTDTGYETIQPYRADRFLGIAVQSDNSGKKVKELRIETESVIFLPYLLMDSQELTALPREIRAVRSSYCSFQNNRLTTLPESVVDMIQPPAFDRGDRRLHKSINRVNLTGNPLVLDSLTYVQKLWVQENGLFSRPN